MNEVYMQTGEMAGYQAGQFNSTNNPLQALQCKMAEGQDFAKKDAAACKSLQTFTTDANEGLMAYTHTGHQAVKTYLSTEAYNIDEFNKIGNAPARPPGIPDVLRIDGVGFERTGR